MAVQPSSDLVVVLGRKQGLTNKQRWWRGRLKSGEAGRFFVSLIDKGTVIAADVSAIRRLPPPFVTSEPRAVACSWACIQPASGAAWSDAAKARLRQLFLPPLSVLFGEAPPSTGFRLFATLLPATTQPDHLHIAQLKQCDSRGVEGLSIPATLVKEGLAAWSPGFPLPAPSQLAPDPGVHTDLESLLDECELED